MVNRAGLTQFVAVCLLSVALAACNMALESTEPTTTPWPTATASVAPTAPPTPTIMPSPTTISSPTPDVTATPTVLPTRTPPPTVTPLPTTTPFPTVGFSNDQWTNAEIPPNIRQGLDRSWFAILNIVEQDIPEGEEQTLTPPSETQTLYLVNPSSGEQVEIMSLPASTEDRIFWAPDGNKLVYFLEPTLLPDGARGGGLYLVNFDVEISLRLFNTTTLSPRGIPDHHPVWSPDSSRLAVALPTAYDVDIFIVSADGSVFLNATAHGAYDLWPAWSPDGRRLAFVSDRHECPTWTPGESGSCATLEALPPTGGHLFVMDVETGDVQQVSDVWVDGPPTWVSNLQIAFTTGLSDPFAAESHLWLANIQSGIVREVSDPEGSLNLGAAWSPGGLQVLYHRASEPASVILKDANGNLITSTDEFLFSRFGFEADWSLDGEYIAFGGRSGQCPYGLIVRRSDFTVVYGPTSAPRVCNPSYSPDGRWMAYAGIRFGTGDDGRLDLYIAQTNGYNARNLTSRLRGDVRLLGWVGSAQP